MIYEDILQTIGKTPIVRINKLAPAHVHLFVKLESFNPMGSIKDRLALGVIEDAERRGPLEPGQTVIEATSGNTGIGLAMACARKGYPLVVTMAENFSVERRRLMRFLGAKVVLTPAAQKGSGMLAKAVELAETNGWFLTRQFENEANADIHSRTTAQEILADFERLDYWVTGERYLSTPLFEDIDSEMDEEEWAISRSTPSCRFDATVPPPPAPPERIIAVNALAGDVDAEAFVEAAIADPSQPVVMFALEWCEFCWSVRRMFAALDIPYRSVDLDCAANQQGDWGGRVRRALQAQTKSPTIPQIFIGGAFVGGCTELFEAWRAGNAQTMLAEARVKHRAVAGLDPYDFLPKWLHPRAA